MLLVWHLFNEGCLRKILADGKRWYFFGTWIHHLSIQLCTVCTDHSTSSDMDMDTEKISDVATVGSFDGVWKYSSDALWASDWLCNAGWFFFGRCGDG